MHTNINLFDTKKLLANCYPEQKKILAQTLNQVEKDLPLLLMDSSNTHYSSKSSNSASFFIYNHDQTTTIFLNIIEQKFEGYDKKVAFTFKLNNGKLTPIARIKAKPQHEHKVKAENELLKTLKARNVKNIIPPYEILQEVQSKKGLKLIAYQQRFCRITNLKNTPLLNKIIFLKDISEAILSLHEVGIVHGDIKIENTFSSVSSTLLNPEFKGLLADFGGSVPENEILKNFTPLLLPKKIKTIAESRFVTINGVEKKEISHQLIAESCLDLYALGVLTYMLVLNFTSTDQLIDFRETDDETISKHLEFIHKKFSKLSKLEGQLIEFAKDLILSPNTQKTEVVTQKLQAIYQQFTSTQVKN